MTMTLIETKTLGTAAASIEFTSIPQDGTDLLVQISHRQTQTFGDTQGYPGMQFNASTSGYSFNRLTGDGSSGASASYSGAYIWIYGVNDAFTSNTFSNTSYYIPNYTSANQKSVSVDTVQENNATGAIATTMVALWTGTAAISSLKFFALDSALNNTPNFVAGTIISLYKITKGSSGGVVVS